MNAPFGRPGATVEARAVSAELRFAVAGGRTGIVRQHVPYPFHVTRPFRLDRARPDVATLYLQSASGGMYRGDDLRLSLEVGEGAAAHVTTQASTIVHDSHDEASRLETRVDVAPGGVLVYTPDPMILMPGAAYEGRTRVALREGAVAIVAEGFFGHDPMGEGRPFASVFLDGEVRDPAGQLLVRDRGGLAGGELPSPSSPLGTCRAYGSMMLLAPHDLATPGLVAELGAAGVFAALSPLPNGAGQGLKLLAPDGGALARALDLAASRALAVVLGIDPAPRRK